MTVQPRIFLSYSHSDLALADRLRSDLQHRGCSVWVDVKGVKVGDSISKAIESALESADYVCLVLSQNSVSRPWVQREYRAALTLQLATAGDKPRILPVVLEEVDVPVLLRDIRYADFRSGYPRGFSELCIALGIPREAAPFLELLDFLRQTGNPAAAVRDIHAQQDQARLWTIWSKLEQAARQLLEELSECPESRRDVLSPADVNSFLESTHGRTGLLPGPEIVLFNSVDYLSYMDDVSVSYGFRGLDTIVGTVAAYQHAAATRQLYIVPQRVLIAHDGSYPDGAPSLERIEFAKFLDKMEGDGEQ